MTTLGYLLHPDNRQLTFLMARATFVFLAVVASVILIASYANIDGQESVDALLAGIKESYWAPLFVIGIYILLNFGGIPQFLLVLGTLSAFGPWYGALYAWIATMSSSSVGFVLGHVFGGEMLRRYGGPRAKELSTRIGGHGILASALVRVLPAGPAIMVNMAAGVSHITYAKFFIGTGLGIAPKIALLTCVHIGLMSFGESRNPIFLMFVAGGIAAWFAAMMLARRAFRAWKPKGVQEP